ncbi:outer membrane protein assembly factor BamB [Arenimonas caeni]|jgi:outer membrane protein assembly factor BamB|uniref:Outer membrane protein assembly factor BamB n=1 Tax=Arenimonas caeni TaxID=2058085 RepID=A0A2P6MAY5_9GAMM|nr:outer membrane protein assembly factor BamB [Arenimonas caeni]MDY0022272.1 outer membrane protein assembly factor BamB [Arenimonas caeni]PRH83147.1 outer membrane protein assembly factor BamB [Arenimonas caeni]
MLRRSLIIAALLAFATGCSTVKGWFGDKSGKALEPAELVEIANPVSPRQAWSRKLGDEKAALGLRQRPAIEGERLFVADDAGRVMALDLNTGATLWDSEVVRTGKEGSRLLFWRRKAIDGHVTGGPGVGNGMVVAGGRNGEVVALDAETGAERWRAQVTSEVIAAPLVAGDRVVVRSNDGRTFGLDVADGTRKWVFDRGLPTLSVRGNGEPVTDGNLVYLGYDDGTVIALRGSDGLMAWSQLVAEPEGRNELARMADVDGELAVGYTELYATSFAGQTLAISTQNGRPLWNRDTGGYSGLALLGDRVVLADPDGTLWALDRSSGSALWKQEGLARRWLTTPAVQGDFLVVGDVEGYLHWVRASDGTLAGRDRLGRDPIRATPQVSPTGVLLAIDSEGRLAAYPTPAQ